MAKLRHLAITVRDLAKSAAFYENVFGMTRHTANDVAVSLSDGVVNITLLKFPTDEMAGDERGKDFVGLHHMGFVVDDLDEMDKTIRANGGEFHREPTPEMQTETKYRDIDGNVFDITRPEHVWKGVS